MWWSEQEAESTLDVRQAYVTPGLQRHLPSSSALYGLLLPVVLLQACRRVTRTPQAWALSVPGPGRHPPPALGREQPGLRCETVGSPGLSPVPRTLLVHLSLMTATVALSLLGQACALIVPTQIGRHSCAPNSAVHANVDAVLLLLRQPRHVAQASPQLWMLLTCSVASMLGPQGSDPPAPGFLKKSLCPWSHLPTVSWCLQSRVPLPGGGSVPGRARPCPVSLPPPLPGASVLGQHM